MLKNAYFLAKFGADTAENEQQCAEILPIGRRVADRSIPSHSLVAARTGDPVAGVGTIQVCGSLPVHRR